MRLVTSSPTTFPSRATVGASSLLALALGLGLGCNPYEPSLGESPFLCGADEPRCPAGYDAVDETPVRCVCESQDDGDRADGGGLLDCEPDTNEPNESVVTPTVTAVSPGVANNQIIMAMTICPGTDVDVYEMTVNAGQSVSAYITFDAATGPLSVSLLNAGGTVLAQGTPTGNGQRATLQSAPANGKIYAQVTASSGVTKTYAIQVQAN